MPEVLKNWVESLTPFEASEVYEWISEIGDSMFLEEMLYILATQKEK